MATQTILDYRRTDQRIQTLENPYWITSGVVSAVAADDLGALLFSFPNAGEVIVVRDVVVENIVAITAATTIDVGLGSLATDAVTTAGVLTVVDDDEFIKNADTVLTAATCWGSTTSNTSDWLTAAAANTYAAPRVIVGAATTVPCVYALVANAGTISAGTFRVHMLITRIPGTN
jgi:hypothetical protein